VCVTGGGLFNLYSGADPRWEWLPDTAGLVEDDEVLVGCAIECRSEGVVAEAAALIADEIDDPVWLIDGDGVVWPASRIDVASVVL